MSVETSSQKSFSLPFGKRNSGPQEGGRPLKLWQQLIYQALALLIAFIVIFPILWIVSLSLNPKNVSRPKNLIPEQISFDAYLRVLDKPTANPVTFRELAVNQLKLAGGSSIAAVLIGVLAAYSFSRFNFKGRKALMVTVVTVLMLPSIATVAPLFVLLNKIQISLGDITFNLRDSLWGVGLAVVSGQLPFAIWNLKGYLDTIPKEIEEAAIIDGASPNQMFISIVLPLAMPALAVTGFLAFSAGWTEFVMSWQFLTKPQDFTLAMSLWNMVGQFSGDVPWSVFAAMALMVASPVAIVYLMLQRYIVGGMTLGGIK
ncbi:MAG TPA: ABC transporter permease subunit [Anaerolineaceae bacterium]|nr:ABC transporter permease subunit [Anaerolineaceae bacterium]HPN50641.1 ABC transporter permease subunit [Anaerolineaceae bacterium]